MPGLLTSFLSYRVSQAAEKPWVSPPWLSPTEFTLEESSATLQAFEWCGGDSLKHIRGLPRPDDHLALGPELNFRGEHTAQLEEASGPEREVATQGLQTLPEPLTEREEDRGPHPPSRWLLWCHHATAVRAWDAPERPACWRHSPVCTHQRGRSECGSALSRPWVQIERECLVCGVYKVATATAGPGDTCSRLPGPARRVGMGRQRGLEWPACPENERFWNTCPLEWELFILKTWPLTTESSINSIQFNSVNDYMHGSMLNTVQKNPGCPQNLVIRAYFPNVPIG